jgi:putative spermidine/putrescine transport system substrate-binding protein
MSLIPTVCNADTLGTQPDLIKRPIMSWAELLNPEFKDSILNIPSIGIMDAAMAVEAMGLYKYPDTGNMTKREIDPTIKTLIEAKRVGQFRAQRKDLNPSIGRVMRLTAQWSCSIRLLRCLDWRISMSRPLCSHRSRRS